MKWGKLEPVRGYLYSILAPTVALLVGYGVVDQNWVPIVIGLGTGILGAGATEAARAKVIPTEKTILTGDLVRDTSDQLVPVILSKVTQAIEMGQKFVPQGTWNQGFAPQHDPAPAPAPAPEAQSPEGNPYR